MNIIKELSGKYIKNNDDYPEYYAYIHNIYKCNNSIIFNIDFICYDYMFHSYSLYKNINKTINVIYKNNMFYLNGHSINIISEYEYCKGIKKIKDIIKYENF